MDLVLDSNSDSALEAVWKKDPVLKYLLSSVPQSLVYIKRIINCPATNDGSRELYQQLLKVILNNSGITSSESTSPTTVEAVPEALQRLVICNQHGSEQLLASMVFSRTTRLGKLADLRAQLLLQQGQSVDAKISTGSVSESPEHKSKQPKLMIKFNGMHTLPSAGGYNAVSTPHSFVAHDDKVASTSTASSSEVTKDFQCRKCGAQVVCTSKLSTESVVSAFDPLCDKTNTIDASRVTSRVSCQCGARLSFRVSKSISSASDHGSSKDLIWFSPSKKLDAKSISS